MREEGKVRRVLFWFTRANKIHSRAEPASTEGTPDMSKRYAMPDNKAHRTEVSRHTPYTTLQIFILDNRSNNRYTSLYTKHHYTNHPSLRLRFEAQ